ncbi:MAG: hypothetical protein Hals2KO_12560 [Halioglobus sp.]
MLSNLLMGLVVMMLCLFVQAMLVAVAVQVYVRHKGILESPAFFSTVCLLGLVMILLVIGNFVQIAIWAGLFFYLGEFEDFVTAVYHSAVNFATLGYGDIVMSEHRRLLGPMEAVNGVLMVGVSTAVVMSTLHDAFRRTRDARQQAGRH